MFSKLLKNDAAALVLFGVLLFGIPAAVVAVAFVQGQRPFAAPVPASGRPEPITPFIYAAYINRPAKLSRIYMLVHRTFRHKVIVINTAVLPGDEGALAVGHKSRCKQ